MPAPFYSPRWIAKVALNRREPTELPAATRIIDLHPGQEWSIPIEFTSLNNVAYFAADDSAVYYPDGTATYNRELFRSDGISLRVGSRPRFAGGSRRQSGRRDLS
jgi:hypothetical protein